MAPTRDLLKWDLVVKTYQQTKSIRKAAAITGYSKTGIDYILKELGIPRFPRIRFGNESSSRKAIEGLPENDPRRQVRNKKLMTDMYIEQKLSLPKIAMLLGVTESTVRTGLKQCAIKLRTKSQALKGIARPHVQGSNNKNWKGGITGWRKLARGRLNEHFVRPVMERDGFKCMWCGSLKNLVVHHSKRSFMKIVHIALSQGYTEDNLETFVSEIVALHTLEDGVTLCKQCHDKYHKENGK